MATRPYEVMFVVDTTLDDQVVQGVVNRTIDQIKGASSEILKIEKWGRRKLAYSIKKKDDGTKKVDGYYSIVQFQAEPTAIKELDRQMYLADELLRHKILQLPQEGFATSLAQPPALDEIPTGGGRDRD